MSRRRNRSIVEEGLGDIWELLLVTPWWTGIVIAGFFYVVCAYIVPIPLSTNETASNFIPLFKQIMAPLLGGIVLLMCVAAQIVKLSRRRLAFRPARRDTLDSMTWRQFEQLVGAIYGRQGYRVVEIGGNGPDGGVDLVLHGNGEKVLVQCKQWRNHKVGVKDLREFCGVLKSKNTTADRGIFVTMGRFTDKACDFADENDIEVVDGDSLLRMMRAVQTTPTGYIETDLPSEPSALHPQGVPATETVVPSCPICGRPMVLRTARKGTHAGTQFWGCRDFPKCKGIRQSEDCR